MDDARIWEIEDLTETRDRIGVGRTGLWVGVAIAVLAAIVGWGFIGRATEVVAPAASDATSPMAPPSTAPRTESATLRITSPSAGGVLDRAVITVTGQASMPLGTVHLAVRLGDAVLGWSNIVVDAPGPIAATIRVFAPPFEAPVALHVDAGQRLDAPPVALSIPFTLAVTDGVWSTRIVDTDTGAMVEVDGCAPLVDGDLDTRLIARSGLVISSAVARVRSRDAQAGSAGGRMLGLGSFQARLPVDDTELEHAVVLVGRWSRELAPFPTKRRPHDERR